MTTLTYPVTIDLDELFLDTDGEYDRDTGELLSIRIRGRDLDPDPLRELLAGMLGRELEPLDGETLDRLLKADADMLMGDAE